MREHIKVIKAEPENGGYRLTLECGHTFGPDAAWVQHTTWHKKPVAYVTYCDTCAVRQEVLDDFWAEAF